MVDLRPVNHKLILRSLRLIQEVTGCSADQAEAAFNASGKAPKTAIAMILLEADRERAQALLEEAGGHISALEETAAHKPPAG
jgi:N-acetylmuramic acid 6-phosphate etherase